MFKKCPLSDCQNGGEAFIPALPSIQYLTLDWKTGLLFWTDEHQIWSVELSGRNQKTYLNDKEESKIDAIAAHSGQLFFVNKTDFTVRRMEQTNPATTVEILHHNVSNVTSLIVAYTTTNQFVPKARNAFLECQQKSMKNGCICLPKNVPTSEYSCECQDQEDLNPKTGKCKSEFLNSLDIFNIQHP